MTKEGGDQSTAPRHLATSWFAIELAKRPAGDLAADIEKQGAYVSPHVRRVEVTGQTVRYQVDAGTDAADIAAKMARYLDLMVSKFRKLPRKVVHVRPQRSGCPLEPDVYQRLRERGWVREVGRGQVALAGPALNAFRAVDQDARQMALTSFGAREEAYPTLIPTAVLGRCGYLSSFPQNVSMVTHLAEDFDAIESFRRAHARETNLLATDPSAFVPPEACLVPALCYHCYLGLENVRLSGGPRVVTTVGKCFRYESINMTGLERLWDFTMREIVFVGTADEVVTRRARGIELVKAQIEKWDLHGEIESASDPFFSATYASKSYAQLRGDLKFELRLTIGEADTAESHRNVACASFNLHDNFFGRTFAIEAADGGPAFTGCIGWGLERWVLALFTQHGFEPSRWPEAVRAQIWG